MVAPLSRGLITNCRTVCVGRWIAVSKLGGGVFGLPSLPFSDGLEQQDGPGRYIGVGRCGAFPHVRTVLRALRRVDTGCFKQLPNELAPLSAVIGEALVGPLSGDQHAAPRDAEMLGLVGFALAAP